MPGFEQSTSFSRNRHSNHMTNMLNYAQIRFKQSAMNLSFALDCNLAMNEHISNIA